MAKWAFSPFRNREGFSVTHWIGSPSLFYPVRTLRETKMTVSLLVLMNSNRVSLRENESVLLLSDLECNTTREEVVVASPQEYKNPFVPDYRADYDYTFLHVNSANGNKQERSFLGRKHTSEVVFLVPKRGQNSRDSQWSGSVFHRR